MMAWGTYSDQAKRLSCLDPVVGLPEAVGSELLGEQAEKVRARMLARARQAS